MKTIEQLSEATLKRKLKEIYALPIPLNPAMLDMRTRIEKRLWEFEVERHPPIHTPRGFVNDPEEDW